MNNDVMYSSKRDDWRTPEEILDLVRRMGEISFDPCASENQQYWFAKVNQTKADNGLDALSRHRGVTYINPPYGRSISVWVDYYGRAHGICQAIMLVPARTDTKWFHRAWHYSHAYCFWRGRITFEGAKHPAPFPSILFYKGDRPHRFCDVFRGKGILGTKE